MQIENMLDDQSINPPTTFAECSSGGTGGPGSHLGEPVPCYLAAPKAKDTHKPTSLINCHSVAITPCIEQVVANLGVNIRSQGYGEGYSAAIDVVREYQTDNTFLQQQVERVTKDRNVARQQRDAFEGISFVLVLAFFIVVVEMKRYINKLKAEDDEPEDAAAEQVVKPALRTFALIHHQYPLTIDAESFEVNDGFYEFYVGGKLIGSYNCHHYLGCAEQEVAA